MKDFEYIESLMYMGYGISKVYELDFEGRRKSKAFYLVDDGDDYVGERFDSMQDAKRFIGSLL